MASKVNMGLAVAGILAVLAGGGAMFIGSGVYNIGADDHHTKMIVANLAQEDILDSRRSSGPSSTASR